MSRASNLAKAIGADGTLNVADVAGLAAVASSGSASDLSTGTLPIARIADGAVTPAKLSTGAPTWNSSSQVGFGVASPLHRVHIASGSTSSAGFLYGNGAFSNYQRGLGTQSALMVTGANATDTDGQSGLLLIGNNNTSITPSSTNAFYGGLEFVGTETGKSNGNASSKAMIAALPIGSGGSVSGYGADLVFYTKPDNGTPAFANERMRLTAGGNLTMNGGSIVAQKFTNTFSTAITDYRTTSPNSTSILLEGSPNDRDCWIVRDPAGGSNNWGIYYRNVDSAVGTVAENSVAFVGGPNVNQFSISLANGNLTHQGLPAFTARAFANFVATGPTGTLSFRGSGNMSSITDYGTYWTFNFATAMPDTGYAAVVSGEFGGSDTAFEVGAPTTSGFNLWASVGSGGDSSPSTVSVIVVR